MVKLKSQTSLSADDREDATSNLIAVIGQFLLSYKFVPMFWLYISGRFLFFAVLGNFFSIGVIT